MGLAKHFAQSCLDHWDKLGCNNEQDACMYDYGGGIRCAIGIGLSDQKLRFLDETGRNETGVADIIDVIFDVDLVQVTYPPEHLGAANYKEYLKLAELQDKHDMVCMSENNEDFELSLAAFRAYCEELVAEKERGSMTKELEVA